MPPDEVSPIGRRCTALACGPRLWAGAGRRAGFPELVWGLWFAVALAAAQGAEPSPISVAALPPASPVANNPHAPPPPGDRPRPDPEIERLIGELDAAQYQARNRATQALTDHGVRIVPHLVEALEHRSRETRFRAGQMLRHQFTFEQIGPALLDFVGRSDSRTARTILYERALRQLDDVSRLSSVEQLFEFWGTSVAAFRRQILNKLDGGQGGADVRDCIIPLLEISRKAAEFAEATRRLQTLGLAYDNQYSAAFVVAHTLALGLRTGDAAAVAFADRYVQALEELVEVLESRESSRSVVRKEVADRAVYSQGAADFLAQAVTAPGRPAVQQLQSLGIALDEIQDEFFRGLGSVDRKACYHCVGKVHIADMLTELLIGWPEAPGDGIVGQLIAAATATVHTGDKPKALALLNALEACRDLPQHGLELHTGLGQRLAERVGQGALAATTNRDYHPARAMFDRILTIVDCEVGPQHDAFPNAAVEQYLTEPRRGPSDAQRLAVERYGNTLKRLREAGVAYEQPGVQRFLAALRHGLADDHELVRNGLSEVMRLLPVQARPPAPPDATTVDAALAEWTAART